VTEKSPKSYKLLQN